MSNLLSFPIPKSKLKYPQTLSNLQGDSLAFIIKQLSQENKHLLLICKTNQQANKFKQLLSYLGVTTYLISDYDTLPYDNFSPTNLVVAERLHSLQCLLQNKAGVYIASSHVVIQRFAPKNFLAQQIKLNINENHQLADVLQYLKDTGYIMVETVTEQGEYSRHGNNIDFFPVGHKNSYRLTFIDQLERIREIENGLPIKEVEMLEITLTSEYPTNSKAIKKFISKYRSYFKETDNRNGLDLLLEKGIKVQGLHYYLHLFFDQTANLFDYLSSEFVICYDNQLHSHLDSIYIDLTNKYSHRVKHEYRPPIKLTDLYLLPSDFANHIKKYIRYAYSDQVEAKHAQNTNLAFSPLPELTVDIKSNKGINKLIDLIVTNLQDTIVISVQSIGRRDSMLDIFFNQKVEFNQIDNLSQVVSGKFNLIVSPFQTGFVYYGEHNFYLLTELDLFGSVKNYNHGKLTDPQVLVESFDDLTLGQLVVHKQYGIARYKGLQTINANGNDSDFLELEYADGKLFLPVHDLDLISKHSDDLGEKSFNLAAMNKRATWEKIRDKAFAKIKDIAAELLQAQANRESSPGIKFSVDQAEYQEFVDHFNFSETPDQLQAINQVIADMQSINKMDRLICGDVGFGKTEVAMRAAFIAIQNGYQVAILVPTTLLADQHFKNFKDRFAYLGCNIELLSRFRTTKQIKKIIEELQAGIVDILIGTHMLLNKNIKFKSLGLLIVDEEHQFGVTHKEKIKQLRGEIDILTMTATPIPRTLNMAISGLRDLSIIQTAPENRLEIKTLLHNSQDEIIKIAIERELNRGGQVFFLHNKVINIEQSAKDLAELVPTASIAIAHGQMHESELEKVMLDFYNQRFNVLVCTTIIETGIDIPNANTIIINQADKFGLAQLHQLRGRVGRSHHQAYAYLIVNDLKYLTVEARSRLQAICQYSSLGAGYHLATRDLEIRGAGNILGKEQSGHADKISFNLYIEMLDNVVEEFRKGKTILNFDDLISKKIDFKFNFPLLIPESYIFQASTRLSYYKRISSANNNLLLEQIRIDMIDNFGALPPPVQAIFKVHKLQIDYQNSGITRIDGEEQCLTIYFANDNRFDIDNVLSLVKQNPVVYKLKSNNIRINLNFDSPLTLLNELTTLLHKIIKS